VRLGTTSYILPADILPNVQYLAPRVDDVELVLFEVDDGQNNLPSTAVVGELAALASEHDLSYTVHLPLDLRMGDDGSTGHASLEKAQRVIERTKALAPWAYVLHLEGKHMTDYEAWIDQAACSLELTAAWAGAPELLAVENLEGYPLDFIDPVLERVPVSRCLDIGHLWVDGHDPVPFLERHLARARVIHLHGLGSRDHQSLSHADSKELARVLRPLLDHDYQGVLTLEVFGQADFESSVGALQAAGVPWPAG
jgi:sugar phosphate isomerase/epimerase